MKKIVILITAVFLSNLFLSPVALTENIIDTAVQLQPEELDIKEYEKLKAVGIVTETFTKDEGEAPVTRGKFAKLAAGLLGGGINRAAVYRSKTFSDVPLDGEYADAVYTLYEMGIISGVSGSFATTRNITYAEAATILVNITGYRDVAEFSYGGYPAGYLLAVSAIGVNKGVSKGHDQQLSLNDALKMLFNAATVDIFEHGSIIRNKNLLNIYYKVYSANGVIEADSAISYIQKNAQGMNKLIINGQFYTNNQPEYDSYLGHHIEYLYKKTDDGLPYELLYASPIVKQNNVLEIQYDELVLDSADFNLETIVYKDKRFVSRKANLEQLPVVVYNGQLYEEYDVNDFKIDDGFLRLIDNNSDDVYDFILIEETQPLIVTAVAGDGSRINGRYNAQLNLPDLKHYTIRNEAGEMIDKDRLRVGDVIDYGLAKNGKFARLYKTAIVIKGEVSTISVGGDGENEYVIGGKGYSMSPHLIKQLRAGALKTPLKLGDICQIRLDKYGRIAGAVRDGDSYEYAYLIKMGLLQKGIMTSFLLRMFLDSGETLDALVCGEVKIDNTEKLDCKSFHADSRLKDGTGAFKRQLVKVKINSLGELKELNFASTNTDAYGYSNNDDFICNFSAADSAYKSSTTSFDGRYSLNAGTVIFSVPKADEYDDGDFSLIKPSALIDNTRYTVSLYESDATLTAGIAVVEEDKKASYELSFFVVDKVYSALNDDNAIVKKATGISRGNYVTYYEYEADVFPKDIKNGDVLRVAVKNEYVRAAERIVSLQDTRDAFIHNGTDRLTKVAEGFNNVYLGVFGVLYGKSATVVSTLNPDGADRCISSHSLSGGTVYVTIYDVPTGGVRLGKVSDVVPSVEPGPDGSVVLDENSTRVLLYRRYDYIREIVLVQY